VAVCSAVVNNGLDSLEVYFILGHYDPPSTGRIQQLAYNTNHKQHATIVAYFSWANVSVTVVTFSSSSIQ